MLNFIAAASISSFFFGLFGVSWESVDDKIRREFPSVKSVSTDQLRSRYEEAGEILPLVIDVREVDEFGVSHLGDALNLETAQAIVNMVAQRGLGKETEIVVYRSVSYRSAAVAADLQELGFTRVFNLEHSLFDWANKGYPMIDSNGSTDKVHTFSRVWSVLVDDSLHAYPAK